MKDKTILMTIGHGIIARNLLRTHFLDEILKREDVTVVILTPGARDKEFKREFESHRVIIEDLPENPYRSVRENLLNILHSHMVFTETTQIKYEDRKQREKLVEPRYQLRKLNSRLWGRNKALRSILQKLDILLLPDIVNKELFIRYEPDLVFVTSLLFRRDFDVLKRALSDGVRTVGMVKSWDNLVKDIPMRGRPHKLIVWNELMKGQAQRYHLIHPNDIAVTGIPQFDPYVDEDFFMERDAFIRGLGGDPNKRLLLFAGAGRWTPNDPDIVKIIHGFIKNKKLIKECQLLVRPHFIWPEYVRPLTKLAQLEGILVDTEWKASAVFPDWWDPTLDNMKRLANSLKHSDMLITSFSTIVIDMACFDKPIVNIAFDGFERKPPQESMARWYNTGYYKDVISCRGTILARNEAELLSAINRYLQNPNLEGEGRALLRKRFCYKLDGNASRRIAQEVLRELDLAVKTGRQNS